MVLNYIWIGFFVVAFIIALVKVIFLGDTEIFTAIMNATFDSSKTAFEISLGLTGVMALWLGIMKIGENSGLINALARFLSPVLCRLFPDIPKGHPDVPRVKVTPRGKSTGNWTICELQPFPFMTNCQPPVRM